MIQEISYAGLRPLLSATKGITIYPINDPK